MSTPSGYRRWWPWILGVLGAGLLLGGVVAWARARPEDEPPTALAPCMPTLGVAGADREKGERAARTQILDGAGAASSLVEIAGWDPAVTWEFRSRDRSITYDGFFQAPDHMYATETQLDRPDREHTLEPSHHVFIGREVWEENPNLLRVDRQHCEMGPEYVMFNPLNVTAIAGRPGAGPPGTGPVPSGRVTLRPGVRLHAEPGTPTTVDGEPGTAYVWSPAEDPWLRAEFVLDRQNQLRSATVTDTARNEVIAEMTAHPTDARIRPPAWS